VCSIRTFKRASSHGENTSPEGAATIVKMMGLCDRALMYLSWNSSSEPGYALWLALKSLAKRLCMALAIAKNSKLQDIIDIILQSARSCNEELVKEGVVKKIYRLEKGSLPSMVEGEMEEVLEKVKRHLVHRYELQDDVKDLIEKLLRSPVRIDLTDISAESPIAKLLNSSVCELYLVPKGYPIGDSLWFRSCSDQNNGLDRVEEMVDNIVKLYERLPDLMKEYVGAYVETVEDILNSLKESRQYPGYCTHPTCITIPHYNLRGDIVCVTKYCPRCGKVWRE